MSPHTPYPREMCAVNRNNLNENSERKRRTYSNWLSVFQDMNYQQIIISTSHLRYHFKIFFSFFFFNLFLRQRESMSRRGAERERETQNLKQAPGSELSAQSPMQGSNSQTVRWWHEPKSDAQPTEPPRCPLVIIFNVKGLFMIYRCGKYVTNSGRFSACILLLQLPEKGMESGLWIGKVQNKNLVFSYMRWLSCSLKDKVFSPGTTANNKIQWKNIFG